ncbi:MAG: hydrogenase nickel incorporation protein HypB [Firmicutes bacterium]|nr:hydrogenase nickel incorporation protein HypB [Bacillota bacterium]MBR7112935.1 hydrogenase nickel incorporation protein HypB [Bacillota bacterium]
MKLDLNMSLMEKNDAIAAAIRAELQQQGVYSINIIGSPGAGKTSLLERLLPHLPLQTAVIEGDLATARDAQRISACAVPAVQINTDGGCHLDAAMIKKVLPVFDLAKTDLLIIENVGNLVCPTGFDLGEDLRIVLLSLAEGGDKPAKYPATFLAADLVLLNKIDLAELCDVDIAQVKAEIAQINPKAAILEVCCRKNHQQGLEELAALLLAKINAKKTQE